MAGLAANSIISLSIFLFVVVVVVVVTKQCIILFLSANIVFTEKKPITGNLTEQPSEKTAETTVPESNKTIVSHSDGSCFAWCES